MPAVIYYGKSSNRKNMSACREQIGDGDSLSTRDKAINNYRRIDGKFSMNRPYNELIGLVEDSFYAERVAYIKNTSGGSWAAGILLETSTTLTSAGSCTAPNITAGVNQVITLGTITGTIEAGSLTKWTDADSPNPVQYAICTAVGSGTDRTFDELPYDMTTPSVVVIPAIAATAATNASAGEAKWVVTSAIANNGYAFVYGAAYVTGLDTSLYSLVGSKVYLGTAGASTPTAPSTVTSTVQRVGQVVVKSATVGEIKYFPKERAIEKIANGGLQSVTLTSGVTGVLSVANGGTGSANSNIIARTTTQTVTNSTTLTADNTLIATLVTGKTYVFKLKYYISVFSTSGAKADLNGGTATFSRLVGDWTSILNATFGGGNIAALATPIGGATGTTGTYVITAEGTLVCNGNGTFGPRFAQQAETGAAETAIALQDSFLQVTALS